MISRPVVSLAVVGVLMAFASAAGARTSADAITLRASDALADPAAATAMLRSAGVDGQVFAVPAVAESVGVWVLRAETPKDPCDMSSEGETRLHTIGQPDPATLVLRPDLLRESDGYFTFYVGRPVQGGERPTVTPGSPPQIARDAPGLRPPGTPTMDARPGCGAAKRAAKAKRAAARKRRAAYRRTHRARG
jgi:hypothetical protein